MLVFLRLPDSRNSMCSACRAEYRGGVTSFNSTITEEANVSCRRREGRRRCEATFGAHALPCRRRCSVVCHLSSSLILQHPVLRELRTVASVDEKKVLNKLQATNPACSMSFPEPPKHADNLGNRAMKSKEGDLIQKAINKAGVTIT